MPTGANYRTAPLVVSCGKSPDNPHAQPSVDQKDENWHDSRDGIELFTTALGLQPPLGSGAGATGTSLQRIDLINGNAVPCRIAAVASKASTTGCAAPGATLDFSNTKPGCTPTCRAWLWLRQDGGGRALDGKVGLYRLV